MNESMDRVLADWLHEGPESGPREGLERALAATRRVGQRPGWTLPERWLPMQLTMARTPSQRPILAIVMVALLIVALVATALYVGSQRRVCQPSARSATAPSCTRRAATCSSPTSWPALTDARRRSRRGLDPVFSDRATGSRSSRDGRWLPGHDGHARRIRHQGAGEFPGVFNRCDGRQTVSRILVGYIGIGRHRASSLPSSTPTARDRVRSTSA